MMLNCYDWLLVIGGFLTTGEPIILIPMFQLSHRPIINQLHKGVILIEIDTFSHVYSIPNEQQVGNLKVKTYVKLEYFSFSIYNTCSQNLNGH